MKFFTTLSIIFFLSISSFAGSAISLKDKSQPRKPSSSGNYEGDGKLYFEVSNGEVLPVVLSAYNQGVEDVKCIYATSMKTTFNDSKLCISSGKLEFKNGSLMFNNYPLTYSWSIGPEGGVRGGLDSVKQSDFDEMKKFCAEAFGGNSCYIKVWYKKGQLVKFPNPN